ncbi:mule transposase [Elysia marginata]|uniref:Mule transposase n=1 Tax=Elysia marginata TaxID=1093978 RepID=A0AAV4JIW0_9GAST|nr:mule transposase [Elysia marginata]
MSGKRRWDYQAVLRALKGELERLHGEGASFDLEAVLADFEAAVWGAFRHVFSAVEMRGCNFHWGQAVFRKIQELRMQPGFQNDLGLNQYC